MEAGQQIRDFILEKKIGAGGVGEVWRARHQHLDKAVAIKAIYRHLSEDSQFRDRALLEPIAMAKLDHPHIVPVYDFFFLAGISYLVMAYIEGGSLADLLKSRGRLTLHEALRISRAILDALNFAHSRGVIHRDVKPSNILVRPDGHAYLVDFGIALVVGKPRVTRFGTNIGTPAYMSPEQIQAHQIDHRTDVYSFGCVLYEMLAGHPPFGGQDDTQAEYEIMSGHLHAQPPSLRQINPEVDLHTEEVVFRALAKNPDDRYGGCQELAEELCGSADFIHVHQPPVTPMHGNADETPLKDRLPRRRPWRKLIVLPFLLVGLGLVIFQITPLMRSWTLGPNEVAQEVTDKNNRIVLPPVKEEQTAKEEQPATEEETLKEERTSEPRPVTISQDSALPLRVLVRPLSHIYRDKDAKEIVKENVPTFQAYYVYTRPALNKGDTRSQGWYEVGSNNRGEVLGWMRAEDVIEWKQTMSLAYTHSEGRHPVLMFSRQEALSELVRLPTQLRQQRVQQLYATIESGKAIPSDFPVVSVEPKQMIDINKTFYLLPIINFEVLERLDGAREGRLLQLAAATAFGPEVRDTADIRTNVRYRQQATDASTAIDPLILQGLQADIVFVIDTTISMQPYINGLRETMRNAVRYVSEQAATTASVQFGLWGYRDDPQKTPGIEYNTRNYTPTLQPIHEFERTLAEVKEARASSPGYPQDVFSGVYKALTETKWRPGALRFLLLIGDAPGHVLGHPQNLSGQNERTLRSFANDQKVYILAFYIKNPRYTRYHALAANQFRGLADNQGVRTGPTFYDSISTGELDAFGHHLRGAFERLVQMVKDAKQGQVALPKLEGGSPAQLAADMGYAALVQWIGSKAGAPAPRDITAWAVDKDLVNLDRQAMDVRVLLNKRQLDSLRTVLSEVIAGGRRGKLGGEDFFSALQAVSATVVREPNQIKNARSLVDLGLIPDFLKGLPYTSQLMAMDNELWNSWSNDEQDQFLNQLEAKSKYYVVVHDTQEGWVRLNPQDDADEDVFPVPLDQLP